MNNKTDKKRWPTFIHNSLQQQELPGLRFPSRTVACLLIFWSSAKISHVWFPKALLRTQWLDLSWSGSFHLFLLISWLRAKSVFCLQIQVASSWVTSAGLVYYNKANDEVATSLDSIVNRFTPLSDLITLTTRNIKIVDRGRPLKLRHGIFVLWVKLKFEVSLETLDLHQLLSR